MELGFGKRRVMEFGAKIGNGDGEAFMITSLSERERGGRERESEEFEPQIL